MENDILVSISCATYNHESYIRQCLEGFVMQKTNFEFEILIHDDASTDRTAAIIREYVDKYPNLIKPIFQTENQYSKGVPISQTYNWPRARGKYIALCEGDDYWTDPYKLQKQVDFLDANPEYGLVWGKAVGYIQDKDKFGSLIGCRAFSFDDLIKNNSIPTMTVMCRRYLLLSYNEEIGYQHGWKMGDYPLWLYISTIARIYFFDEVFGVYRILSNSASHSTSFEKKIGFSVSSFDVKIFFLKREYPNNFKKIERLDAKKNETLFTISYLNGEFEQVIKYFKLIPFKYKKIKTILRYIIVMLKK